jgi:nucleotide-binding universal stress UspA family protein
MVRSILIPLDGSPHSDAAIDLGLEWARRVGSRVIGLGIVDEPAIVRREPVPLGAFSFKEERDRIRRADAQLQVRAFLKSFADRCVLTGVAATTLEVVGSPASSIIREAQRADVILMARETHFAFETQDQPDAILGSIVRKSPRPVVVVPPVRRGGEGVLVAYGGGREVARALQTFLLLGLGGSETMHLVSVQREGWEASELANLAADYLSSHNLVYRLHPMTADRAPADAILDQVSVLRPRFLVMGAQGHHPVRDLFVTSVTRAVLHESPVPVFIGA